MKRRVQPRPAPQSEYIFQVESLSHEGRGIAHYGSHPDHPLEKHGKKVFIRYALPGETVRARITREVKNWKRRIALSCSVRPPRSGSNLCVHILAYAAAAICSISIQMRRLNLSRMF